MSAALCCMRAVNALEALLARVSSPVLHARCGRTGGTACVSSPVLHACGPCSELSTLEPLLESAALRAHEMDDKSVANVLYALTLMVPRLKVGGPGGGLAQQRGRCHRAGASAGLLDCMDAGCTVQVRWLARLCSWQGLHVAQLRRARKRDTLLLLLLLLLLCKAAAAAVNEVQYLPFRLPCLASEPARSSAHRKQCEGTSLLRHVCSTSSCRCAWHTSGACVCLGPILAASMSGCAWCRSCTVPMYIAALWAVQWHHHRLLMHACVWVQPLLPLLPGVQVCTCVQARALCPGFVAALWTAQWLGTHAQVQGQQHMSAKNTHAPKTH